MLGYLQSVRAEIRKLSTVRSTYYMFGLVLLLEILFSFYIFGYHISPQELAADGPNYLRQIITNGIYFTSTFPALVVVLLVTHEYRHSTILYTLTSSPSRLRIFLAKLKVSSVYMIITTALVAVAADGLSLLGLHLAGHHIISQSVPYSQLIWQVLFYGWSIAMFGFVLAFILRNQVAAIVSLLVIPYIIEPILTQLLKANSVYLPFTAAGQVIGDPTGNPSLGNGSLSPGHAALVVLIYLVVGWVIGAILFQRRSAL